MKIKSWVSIILSLNLLESQVLFTQDYNEHQEPMLQEAESSLNCYPMMNPEEVTEVQNVLRLLNLETEIETGDLSQYTLPQNVFPETSRTVKVCHGSVKTILEQSPYEISSSSLPVSRLNSYSFSSRVSGPRKLVEGGNSIDFFPNSTSAANCFVAPGLEASSSFCTLNFCAPSASCTSSSAANLERSLISRSISQQNPNHIIALTENYQKRVLFAESCRKVAEILQAAAEYAQRITEALSLGNENEGHQWSNVVKYLELQAKDQIVAIKKIKKVDFSNSEMIQKNNADQIPKTTTVHRMNGTDNTINKMGLSICCEKWLAETNSREGVDKILSNYVVNVLKKDANHQLVQAFEKYWDHVAKAHELGDDPQALAWIQIAEDIQEGIVVSIEQAKAVESAKKAKIIEDENPWDDTYWRKRQLANILEYTYLEMKTLAQCREQFIKAEESFQPLEIVNYWKVAIEGYQFFTQYYRKAAQSHISGKYEDFENLLKIAKFGNFHVTRLKHIIEWLEKSNSALARETDPELLILRKQVIEHWEKAIEYYNKSLQSIKFCCHQDVINYELFDKIDDTIKLYDLCDLYLVMAFDILEDVTKVRKANQKEIAEPCDDRYSIFLLKASEQFQESVKYYFQLMTASSSNNYFDQAAQSASTSAYYFRRAASAHKKVIQAQEANQEELVKLCIDRHEHNQETEEDDLITRTEEISQKELAHLWLEIFKQNEETAEYYQKSAKAYAAGNKEEGDCLGGNDDCRQGRGYIAKQAADRLRSKYRLESDSE